MLPTGSIEGQPGGYRLTVAPDAVDALRFERLLVQARQEEGPGRVRLLREALALWRGAAMQDVALEDSQAFDATVTRLEALRLTAMEDRFEAEVSLGQGVEVIAELTDAVTAHPRGKLVAALMRAQAAAGRDSEALFTYERTREALADALGVDPSPELSALHVALLRGELGRREQNRKTNMRAELTSFVGRDDDVAAVRELITEHRRPAWRAGCVGDDLEQITAHPRLRRGRDIAGGQPPRGDGGRDLAASGRSVRHRAAGRRAGRDAAGHRTGRGQVAHHVHRTARQPAR